MALVKKRMESVKSVRWEEKLSKKKMAHSLLHYITWLPERIKVPFEVCGHEFKIKLISNVVYFSLTTLGYMGSGMESWIQPECSFGSVRTMNQEGKFESWVFNSTVQNLPLLCKILCLSTSTSKKQQQSFSSKKEMLSRVVCWDN